MNGPRSTPESRLAYWLNAYNAVAMYLVISTPLRPDDLVRFFILTRVRIDGETTSLYALENDVIRPLGDPHIHFTFNCMARGCPRLPRAPFTAAGLAAELDRETRRFLAAPSLPTHANRYRDEKIPEDYRVRFIPYDWTLNQK